MIGSVRGVGGSRRAGALCVVAAFLVGSLVAISAPAGPVGAVSDYVALSTPRRLVDTRPGGSTFDGQDAGIGLRSAGSTLEVQVAGRAGVPLDASTAVLTIAAVDPLGKAFLTVYPTGEARPNASNVNYNAAHNSANTVLARIGVDGKVSIFTHAATNLIVDVSGHFPAGSVASVQPPRRLVDTRPGGSTFDGQDAGIGLRSAGSTLEVQVAGRAGVPLDASTAVLTIAAVDPLGNSFLTVHPTGEARPNASNVNYNAAHNSANTVLARIGVDGKVSIFTHAATNLIVDVSGHLPASVYSPLPAPRRLADTRPGAATVDGQQEATGVVVGGRSLQLHVAGRAGVPAGASTAVLTVTAVDSWADAFLTVHPTGDARPNASNVNYSAGHNTANTVLARLGAGGDVCIFSNATTHLIVDVSGYLTGPPPPAAGPTCPVTPAVPIWKGTSGRHEIALTFDAGSDVGAAAKILDLLAAEGVPASFGMTGTWAAANPALVARMAAEGHVLINHTNTHPDMTTITTAQRLAQLAAADATVKAITGASMRPHFRPPFGAFNAAVLADVGSAGYAYSIMWTVDSLGWKGLDPAAVTTRCLNGAVDGAIILMHVGSESTDIDALPNIINGLQARGYAFVTIDGLLA